MSFDFALVTFGTGSRSKPDEMPTDKRRVFSIGTWSPSLRTMLNSRIEPCGCVVGIYLSWRGQPVEVIDVANPRCASHHRFGEIGDVPSATAASVERR